MFWAYVSCPFISIICRCDTGQEWLFSPQPLKVKILCHPSFDTYWAYTGHQPSSSGECNMGSAGNALIFITKQAKGLWPKLRNLLLQLDDPVHILCLPLSQCLHHAPTFSPLFFIYILSIVFLNSDYLAILYNMV